MPIARHKTVLASRKLTKSTTGGHVDRQQSTEITSTESKTKLPVDNNQAGVEKPMVFKSFFYGFLWFLTCVSHTADVIDIGLGWTSGIVSTRNG